MTTDEIIDQIIDREGGYVNDPNDRGGATKYGITKLTLESYRGYPVTIEDVKELTKAEAKEIYLKRYVERPGFEAIGNPSLKALVVDSAVQHGPFTATKWLQEAIGVAQDGIFGKESQEALLASDPRSVYLKLLARRNYFYAEIIYANRDQTTFVRGWAKRINDFIVNAPV